MEDNRKEQIARIEKAVKELPQKAQRAIFWIIEHYDFVEEMCKNSKMTVEEIEKYKTNAEAKEDYIMLALLCAAQTYMHESNEAMKQEN